MLEKHELKTLSDAVSENINFANVIWMNQAANFHTLSDGEEFFCCLEGVAHLDFADGATTTLRPHGLANVPCNALHRFSLEARAVVLIIDAIKG